MSLSEELIKKLKGSGIDSSEADFSGCGYHVSVSPEADQVRLMADIVRNSGFYLDFVSAVHVESGFQVVYQFGHFDEGCHVNAKAMTKLGKIPTISDIFEGAGWHERETKDFYGLFFEGSADMRVLILDEEDSELKPLLKNEKRLKTVAEITRKAVSEETVDIKAAKADKE